MASFDTLGTIKSAVGLGSGLDIQSIVQQLVDAEGSVKKTRLDNQELQTNAKITAFGNLKSALSNFQTIVETLEDPLQFQGRKVSVVNEPTESADTVFFTAEVSSTAAVSTYNIEVEQLAQAHKLGSAPFLAESTVIGTGTLRITVGQDQPVHQTFDIVIGTADQTLSGIRSAINNRSGTTGVTATIVTTDAGKRLVLSSNQSGLKGKIGVAVSGDGDGNDTDNLGLSQLITANLSELTIAQDAKVRIDNQLVTISSNTLTDTIEGITINLSKAADGKVHSLVVSADQSKTSSNLGKFIQSYNDLVDLINTLGKFNPTDATANGDLLGDATLRQIETSLRNALTKIVNNSSNFTSLASIGITSTQSDGKLQLNAGKLSTALATNFDGVKKLFTATQLDDGIDGVATNLSTIINNFLRSGGTLDMQSSSLTSDLKKISIDRSELNSRLQELEVDLTTKYAALDALLGQLNAQSRALTQQLSGFVEPLSFRR